MNSALTKTNTVSFTVTLHRCNTGRLYLTIYCTVSEQQLQNGKSHSCVY